MAGYSNTPLTKKLGIKEGYNVFISHPPQKYFEWLSPLPASVTVKSRLSGVLDFIHVFVKDERSFRQEFIRAKKHMDKAGMLWISWPKKAAKVPTDLDENKIRDFGLKNGLVDVKVCAVDEVWSGLKFVFRVADR